MRSHAVAIGVSLLFLNTSHHLGAQKVVIRGATPEAVIEALTADLAPQGFKVANVKDNKALFTLDRGMVSQQRGSVVGMVHVTLELHLRFKQQSQGLEVVAWEEAVGEGNRSLEFRRRVTTQAELDSVQALLESVRTKLESAAPDQAPALKRDSTPS